jgi:hypothetical protein
MRPPSATLSKLKSDGLLESELGGGGGLLEEEAHPNLGITIRTIQTIRSINRTACSGDDEQ